MQALIEARRSCRTSWCRSLAHFDAVRGARCRRPRLPVNPRLVRGMDYYNLTVFEWITDELGAQGTVCGGGRYDGLIEQMLAASRRRRSAGHGHRARAAAAGAELGARRRRTPRLSIVPSPAALPRR